LAKTGSIQTPKPVWQTGFGGCANIFA